MGNTTHPRKAHYFAYQLNSKAKSTLATYRCLALLCNLFPINFKCTMKSFPVFTDASAPCNAANSQDTLHVLAALRKFFPPKSNIIISTDTDAIYAKAKIRFSYRWVPPASSDSSSSSNANDYHHQVMRVLGYLCVPSSTLTRSLWYTCCTSMSAWTLGSLLDPFNNHCVFKGNYLSAVSS
jgi:hypothetical protein